MIFLPLLFFSPFSRYFNSFGISERVPVSQFLTGKINFIFFKTVLYFRYRKYLLCLDIFDQNINPEDVAQY